MALATAETATAAAGRLWTGLVHGEASPAKLRAVERRDRVLRLVVGAHFDERKSARAAGGLIAHDGHRVHGPGLAEQVLQLGLTDFVRQVSNIQLPTHGHELLCRNRDGTRHRRMSEDVVS